MSVEFLDRPRGRIAYEVRGAGPVVLCSPGLGDLRSTFDSLAELLVPAGYRVALADLRGHGESSTGWTSYGEVEVADDLLALVAELGDGPVALVASSYSAGAAVIAAANAPEAISGLVLTGPFVRDQPGGMADGVAKVLLALPWLGKQLWMAYWSSLFSSPEPPDFDIRRRALSRNLAERGRFAAVAAMFRADHRTAEQALPEVRCPTLVVMGDEDPDFPDPAAEAGYAADNLGGCTAVVMVAGARHYPHAEQPALVAGSVVDFLENLDRSSCRE